MARKSNKTAHVLNLLSGHQEDQDKSEASTTAETKEEVRPPAKPELPVQNISVIDTTEEDPLTALIQNKLSDGLELEEAGAQEEASLTEAPSEATAQEDVPLAEAPSEATAQENVPQAETGSNAEATVEEDAPQTEAPPETTAEEDAPQAEAPPETAVREDAPQVEAPPAPEPDFVRLNIMEHIVQEKIIYFMRQFDVCTCDRCVADVVALTLNGLAPKYIVVDRAAAAPLSDFYTNKFIADVTVEAMKACATIRDNPRH